MNKTKILWGWLVGMLMPLCHAQASRWICNPSDFQYDMVVYFSLQIDDVLVPACSDYEIAAFVENECRGVAILDSVKSEGKAFYSMRIRSNVEMGEIVSFRYYDSGQSVEKDVYTTLPFEHQSVKGLPSNPVTLEAFNCYSVTFLLDDAIFFVDSVIYGGEIVVPEVSDKTGYTFGGWGEVLETMPAQNLIYQGYYILNTKQTDVQGLVYEMNNDGNAFTVTGYTENLIPDVVIPVELYGLPVNAIQEKALTGAEQLKSIVIPNSVTNIGEYVFYGCYNLLVVEWNAEVPLASKCFDEADRYGNMLVFIDKVASSMGFDGFEGNVVVDGVAENIVLVDRLPFRNPRNFMAKQIRYVRQFYKKTKVGIAGGWEGIILPFDVQVITSEIKGRLNPFGAAADGLPCWVAEWLGNSKSFALTAMNTANRPFIMEVPNSEDYEEEFNIEGPVAFTAENAVVYATVGIDSVVKGNGFSLQASYEGVNADNCIYVLNEMEYVADGESFMPGGVFVADLRDVRPFEAYIYNTQLTRSRYFPIKGQIAGVELSLMDKKPNVDVYTLQGIMIKHQVTADELKKDLAPGVYIVDGKKLMVR